SKRDWSSDVCSYDLCPGHTHVGTAPGESFEEEPEEEGTANVDGEDRHRNPVDLGTARLIASRAAVPPMPPRRARPRKEMRRWARSGERRGGRGGRGG